jgi:UDP-N-acetylmuramate dehydrogenase
MQIEENVSLSAYSTMGLGGVAAYLCTISNRNEAAEALTWAKAHNLPAVMIGGGSNIIWRDGGYPGLVIVNNILHYELFNEDETNTYLTVGAGELWDQVVERSVVAGLTGIEALSLIPGKTGATPVQNVGAYGQDISQTLTTVEAYDTQTEGFLTIPTSDCAFGYRTSRFKTTDHSRFFITAITLHLRRGNPMPPFYSTVESYFNEHGIANRTPAALRQAVIDIRSAKLPDPAIVRNCGSFFANPIVNEGTYLVLLERYPNLPSWPADSGIKLPAAWLIEQVGFKDAHDQETGMATWPAQPLVLVNENAKSTNDLLAYKQKIVDAVKAKFNLTLEQEPELLPKA